MKPLNLFTALLMMFTLCLGVAFAQSDRGTIRGTVTDPTSAVLANAKVVLTSADSGETRETTTSGDGIFVFPELKSGVYNLAIEASGFRRTSVEQVKVDVQGVQSVTVKLEVGEVSGNVVTVNAEGVTLNSDTPVRQTTVSERQVRELPLAVGSESGGRTPLSFIFLDSNVGATDQSGTNNASNFRVSGGQGAGVEILIDGASTRRTQNGNFFTEVAPGPNAYQEFTISTNSFSAEFGNSSGGIVNFTLKSGTNQFHGEGYDIVQNEVFNANSVYNKARSIPTHIIPRDRDNQNNFGFNVGGPIWFFNFGENDGPFFKKLKDRAFFFFNYEGYRFNRGANTTTTVPTVKMRSGNFSEYLTDPYVLASFPSGIRIYDPRQPSGTRLAFAGNIIPVSSFDPAGFAILNSFPLPTRAGVHNNYDANVVVPNVSDQYTLKTDFTLTQKQHLTFSFSRKVNERIAGPLPILPLPITDSFGAFQQRFVSDIVRLQHDYTITPKVLNHFNIGYTYFDVVNGPTSYGFNTSSLGIPANATPNLAFPLIDFVGDSNNSNSPRYSIDIGGVDFSDHIRDGALEISDFVTYVAGRHTFKAGASLRLGQYNTQQTYHPGGRFGFHEDQTSSPNDPNPSGSAIASLLTGATEWSFTDNSAIEPAFRQMSQSYFVQDDWKATQKLTLNLGLRYDLPGMRYEATDRYRGFDPDVINPAIGIKGALVGAAGQGGLKAQYRSLAPTDYSNIGPRLGAAYAINSKTVIRGGIGLYYSPVLYGVNGSGAVRNGNIGYDVDTLFQPNGRDTPPNQFLSNFRPLSAIDPNSQFVGDTGVGIPYFDKNFKTGRTLQYTIDLQRELPWKLVGSIGYIGHRADRLRSNFGRINALPLNALKLGFPILNKNLNDLTPTERAYAASIGVALPANSAAVYPGFNGSVAQALRPFPQYGSNFDNILESRGESDYNALQIKIDRRFSQGIQFGLAYTLSRLITNASEDVLGGGSALTGILQNPFDLKSLKTLSPSNPTHVFVANFLAELPFGSGRRFLNHRGIVDILVGGWQIGGIFRYQSGTPLIFALDPDYGTGGNFLSLVGYNGNLRPNLVAGQDSNTPTPCNASVAADFGRRYVLNCRAFAAPPDFATPGAAVGTAAYTAYYADPLRFFGTAPAVNGDARSPLYFSENMNLLKKTRVTETVTLELGAEFFNVFNRVRYLTPDTFLGRPNPNGTFQNTNFGAIGATVEPRVIQMRARIIF
jgi:Carboxypeptidase regulatory-like domain/TonB dependent receptor